MPSSTRYAAPTACGRHKIGLHLQSNPLSFSLFNASSSNKLPELHHMLHTNELDVLCITEIWLHSGIANSTILAGSPYLAFRTDYFAVFRGDGICILAKNRTMKATSMPPPPKYAHQELCSVDILLYSFSVTSVCLLPAACSQLEPNICSVCA